MSWGELAEETVRRVHIPGNPSRSWLALIVALAADAARYKIYGVYGISVFAVRGATVDELVQQAPLVRFDRNPQAQAVVRVVAVDDDGQVHFIVLPGSVEKNRHLVGRALA